MKKIIVILLLLVLCHCGGREEIVTERLDNITYATQPLEIQTAAQTLNLTVEVADDDDKRTLGLMYRESLEDGKGMLFVYDDVDFRGFWMKNTKISLDILFIDAGKSIIHIEENTIPYSEETVMSSEPAQYFLEVPGGYCKKNSVLVGDKLTF